MERGIGVGMEGGKQVLTMHVFLTLLSSRTYIFLRSLGREMPLTPRNLMVSFLFPNHSLIFLKNNDFINSWRNALHSIIFTHCQLLPYPPSSLCSQGLRFLLSLTRFASSLSYTTTPGSEACPGMWSTYQGQSCFPSPTSQQIPVTPQVELGVVPPLPLLCRVLSGLILGKVCASQHNCSEFGCASALLRLEDCTPEVIQSSSTLDPYNLSISISKFPVPFWDVCDVRVQLRAMHLCLHADSGTLLIVICHKKLL